MGATLKPHQVAIRTANPSDLPVLIPLINPAFLIKTFPDGTAGSREKNIASGITPAVNNNPPPTRSSAPVLCLSRNVELVFIVLPALPNSSHYRLVLRVGTETVVVLVPRKPRVVHIS